MELAQGNPLEMTPPPAGSAGPPVWVHILPVGRFQCRDGRGPFVMNDPQAVINNTVAYHGTTDIPVDYDHQLLWTRNNGQPAPAAGWIKELAAKPDGIWGRAEWTQVAAARIVAKEYRYLSPVFLYDAVGTVMKIECVALVNNPALELTAIASAGFGTFRPPALSAEERAVCSQLGLSEAEFYRVNQRRQHEKAECARQVVEDHTICSMLGISLADYLHAKQQR